MMITWIVIVILIVIAFFWWGFNRCLAAHHADWGAPGLNALDGLNRLFCRFYYGLESDKLLDLPETSGAVLMANHSSGVDSLLMAAISPRPVRFLISSEQYYRFGLIWLFKKMGCIPVDLKGHPETALRVALQALEQGEVIVLYPQGGFALADKPEKKLKKGGFWLAQQTQTPIYPVHIYGTRGKGWVILSLFIPMRVQLTLYPPLNCLKNRCIPALQTLFNSMEPLPPQKLQELLENTANESGY